MRVFEHGISVVGDQSDLPLVLIATTEFLVYSGYTKAIVDPKGNSLNDRAVHLAEVKGPCFLQDFYAEHDLRYCVLAMLYHLNRIVDAYVDVAQLFEQIHPLGTAINGNTSDARVFYELDAFLSSARRIYEAVRKVLWNRYGKGNGSWRAIASVFTSRSDLPEAFLELLRESWDKHGSKLKEYRDCVSHNDPLNDGGTTCWVDWYFGRWGVTVRLPANPAGKGRRGYDFQNGPEALAYCHRVACHLLDLCEAVEGLERVRHHLDHPPHPSQNRMQAIAVDIVAPR